MIDLHTHTNFSDGTWSMKKMLEEAEKANIEVLAVTDHDTIKGQKELANMNYGDIYTGKLIPGTEFSVVHDGIYFHLLGYGFDYKKVEEWVTKECEERKLDVKEEFRLMCESCKKNNIKIGNLKYDKTMGWPVEVIFPEIKKHLENKKYFTDEEWNMERGYFERCVTNKKFPVYINVESIFPNAKDVADKIRKAGGKMFVAHLYRYHMDNKIEFLDKLREDGIIDGVEVCHSSFNEEQIDTLKKYCKKYNLLMSAGTDCHGDKKPDIKLGVGTGNMNVSKDLIYKWNPYL